jgi:hypothetical protein
LGSQHGFWGIGKAAGVSTVAVVVNNGYKLGLKGYSLYFLKQSFICCTVSSQSILPW